MSGDCSLRLEFNGEGLVFMESFLPQTRPRSNSQTTKRLPLHHQVLAGTVTKLDLSPFLLPLTLEYGSI